jgi:hypothetical protein
VSISADQFHTTLAGSVEDAITEHADELARSIVATLSGAIDDERGRLIEAAEEAARARDFAHGSAEHIAAKRNLAEEVLIGWETGDIQADTALRMIRAALAVGPVMTVDELKAAL